MHSTFERRLGTGSKAVAFGFFVVLALTFFAFVGNAKAAIETAPPPQIWSDKADYAPGETVVLSGANWAPGDSVHIRVNDDAGQTWTRDVDVTADASGAISDQFNLPGWFVAQYTVTATGAQSGTAVTSFTDGNIGFRGAVGTPGTLTWTVNYQLHDRNAVCGAAPSSISSLSKTITGTGSASQGVGGSNQNRPADSLKLGTVTTPAGSGYVFDYWTDQDDNIVANNACISGDNAGSGTGNISDLYAHFKLANVAPIANAQSVSTNEDTAKTITLSGTDADGNNLTFTIVSGPSNGTLGAIGPVTCTATVPKNCSADVAYTPALNYNGPDSFTFKVNDGTVDSANATVSITVNAVNDAPTCSNGSETTDEDTPVGLTLSCADVDNASLTYTIVSDPAHGDLSGSGATRTYTPDPDYNGSDSFTFKANDGTVDSNVATFSLTVNAVNDAPTCSNGSETTDEDTPVGLTLSCADVDNASLTYTIVSDPAHGDLSGSGATRTYTPDPDYNGSDSFTFKANDGTVDSNVATFSLTVNAVNDAPTCSNGSETTDEDTPVGLTLSCADVDNASLTYTIVSDPAHGDLSGSGATRTYTPDPDYNGSDSFTFKANDGTVDSNVATFSLTVNAVNDAPTCSNGSETTDEDTPVGLTLSCADVDNASLTYTIVSDPAHGDLSGSGATRTYTPDPDYNGSDSFTFKANDGTVDSNVATFSLTITAVDDPPTVTVDQASVTVDEGDTASNSGTYGDVDGDTVTLSATVGTVTKNGDGTWDWSFDTSDGPEDSQTVTITASDGTAGDESEVTFDLTVDNVAPTLAFTAAPSPVDESTTAARTYSFSISDPGDDGATFVSGYPKCGLNGNLVSGSDSIAGGDSGSFQCRFPDGDASSTVEVKVNDGEDDSNLLEKVVQIDNVAPSVEFTTAPATADEGDTKTYQYTYSDPGADTISFATGYPSCGTNGTVVGSPSISSPGSFQCTFPEGPNTTNVAIRVTDGTDASADVQTVNIVEVQIANVEPTATFANNGPVDEGSAVTVSFSGQFDPSAADTTAGFHYAYACDNSLLNSATYAGSGVSASKSCTFGDNGSKTVRARIIDQDDGYTEYQTTVTVQNVNPTASNPSFTLDPLFGTATAGFDFSDVGWLDTHGQSFFSWSVPGSPNLLVTEENNAPDATGHASDTRTFVPGCYNLTVTGTAKDDDGGMSAALPIYSNSSASVYSNGFRPPIMDNERNIAKYGNVVPVKVVLTNTCTGATVTNVPLFVTIHLGTGGETFDDSPVVVAESVSSADTGSQMRTADGMYIYNLSTKSLSANNDYAIRIRPNGTSSPYILQAVLRPKK